MNDDMVHHRNLICHPERSRGIYFQSTHLDSSATLGNPFRPVDGNRGFGTGFFGFCRVL